MQTSGKHHNEAPVWVWRWAFITAVVCIGLFRADAAAIVVVLEALRQYFVVD